MNRVLGLNVEIESSLHAGMRQVTLRELDAELKALGYQRALDMRASCIAKNMDTGNTYPCVTYGVSEVDTGMSAFHVNARRDERFKALQELRRWTFVVQRGAIVGV